MVGAWAIPHVTGGSDRFARSFSCHWSVTGQWRVISRTQIANTAGFHPQYCVFVGLWLFGRVSMTPPQLEQLSLHRIRPIEPLHCRSGVLQLCLRSGYCPRCSPRNRPCSTAKRHESELRSRSGFSTLHGVGGSNRRFSTVTAAFGCESELQRSVHTRSPVRPVLSTQRRLSARFRIPRPGQSRRIDTGIVRIRPLRAVSRPI